MTEPPKKVVPLLDEAAKRGLATEEMRGFWTRVDGGEQIDRRWSVTSGGTDEVLWIHWFPGKKGKGVGSVKLTHLKGGDPVRVKQIQAVEIMTAMCA